MAQQAATASEQQTAAVSQVLESADELNRRSDLLRDSLAMFEVRDDVTDDTYYDTEDEREDVAADSATDDQAASNPSNDFDLDTGDLSNMIDDDL